MIINLKPSKMKEKTLSLIVLATLVVVIFFSCKESSSKDPEKSIAMTNEEMVERGSYLVNAMGCDDCHSPKRMGANGPEIIPELRLSGYPGERPTGPIDTSIVSKGWALIGLDLTTAVGPWGQSFAANITPDTTGIGLWTAEQFKKALREGLYKGIDGSRPILPPMPWFAYKNLTDDDINSVFAYLKSLPAVKNIVPAPKPFSTLK